MVIVVRLDILGSFPSFFKELLRLVPITIRLRSSDSKKNENQIRFIFWFCVDKIFTFMSIGYTVMTFKVTCPDVFAWSSTNFYLYFVGWSSEKTESAYSEITNFSPGCGQYSESAPPSILESNFLTNDFHLFARWFCSIICPWRSRPIILVCWFDS